MKDMKWNEKTVLVTGANGFLGKSVVKELTKENPKKILTTKVDLKKSLTKNDIEKIVKIFSLSVDQKKDAENLLNALYNILIQKDASLIEINPLVITKQKTVTKERCYDF